MKKGWFKYLFIASLIFLVVALIRADYLVIPEIHHTGRLLIALLIVCFGFYLNALSWTMAVRQAGLDISMRDGLVSHGISIFTKYIPGKIWVIMGRAEYVAKRYNYSRKDLTTLSLDAQLISLWAALMIGTIGIVALNGIHLFGGSVLILFGGLSLVIYTPYFHRIGGLLLSRVLKREVKIPKLPFLKVVRMILWYLLNWATWGVGFYILGTSLTETLPVMSIAMAFPLAGSLGIIAVFAPGGLGVREGILTGFLTLSGMDLAMATTISVTSRLWFLCGEVFIFLLSLFLRGRLSGKIRTENR